MGRKGPSSIYRLLCAAGLLLLLIAVQGVYSEHEPTESECRPYIERALKDHYVDTDEPSAESHASSIEQEENSPIDESESSRERRSAESTKEENSNESQEEAEAGNDTNEDTGESLESPSGEEENKTDDQGEGESSGDNKSIENDPQEDELLGDDTENAENSTNEETESDQEATEANGDDTTESEQVDGDQASQEDGTPEEATSSEADPNTEDVETPDIQTQDGESTEGSQEDVSVEKQSSTEEETVEETDASAESNTVDTESQESNTVEAKDSTEETKTEDATGDTKEDTAEGSQEGDTAEAVQASQESSETEGDTKDEEANTTVEQVTESKEASGEGETAEVIDGGDEDASASTEGTEEDKTSAEGTEEDKAASAERVTPEISASSGETTEEVASKEITQEVTTTAEAVEEPSEEAGASQETAEDSKEGDSATTEEGSREEEPVEELTGEAIIPTNLRSRDHITQILKLDEVSREGENALGKTIDNTLNTLKKLYDNAIKPLEILYKYRDLSNRHFGDPEIFSKPLILFMGPWSGGKSSTINYLLDLEFTELALRTGAEPSPAYFNILTYGEETEILDGTQLAADWTFSGLQKFGQGLLDRLRGVKLKNSLLEKVNIVEIPGILEIRKQVQRLFPFNDACQWFIDRADIIFLVYDPAKLDVGPETEAILDQLKGREYQTRIVLNKADQVKPEELMRVQGTLIWNISPLMSSQEPPVMYTTSLWSLPYESHAPTRLLHAQERGFLRDLREAIEKRVENKIASARRFAVRVRNHAKMVDCYLTTYYNHKTFFGNKKKIADDISENPTKYHIYEGLSTLTNISRYDLPDPEMYRDFFRINNLYDFTKLSDTCTYFRGCPINKLDIAIAYELPELVGKYKKAVEQAKTNS